LLVGIRRDSPANVVALGALFSKKNEEEASALRQYLSRISPLPHVKLETLFACYGLSGFLESLAHKPYFFEHALRVLELNRVIRRLHAVMQRGLSYVRWAVNKAEVSKPHTDALGAFVMKTRKICKYHSKDSLSLESMLITFGPT
jgi:hypothetical protein